MRFVIHVLFLLASLMMASLTHAAYTDTVAGTASIAANGFYSGSVGVAGAPSLNLPSDIAQDSNGNFYIADTLNHRILKLDASGVLIEFAGSGVAGDVPIAWDAVTMLPGADVSLTNAQFNKPSGIVFDAVSNSLYVADSGNDCIRKIDLATSMVSAFAGKGPSKPGYADVPAAIPPAAATPLFNAKFNNPIGIDVDSAGNIYVADKWNNIIRKIVPDAVTIGAGIVSTIAGTVLDMATPVIAPVVAVPLLQPVSGYADGPIAVIASGEVTGSKFNGPTDISVDRLNNRVFVADTNNQRIRLIDLNTAKVSTIAGNGAVNPSGEFEGGFSDGEALISAKFSWPSSIAFDALDNKLYISDTVNNRLRTLDLSLGSVVTIVGSFAGFADGWSVESLLWHPSGLLLAADGKIYISDSWNHRIRSVDVADSVNTAPAPSAEGITLYAGSSGTSQIIANDPDPGAVISYSITSTPVNGSAVLSSEGLVTYIPDYGFHGVDSFEVLVNDEFMTGGSVIIQAQVLYTNESAGVTPGCMLGKASIIDPTLVVVFLASIVFLTLRRKL